jgi:flagellar biosynthesis GTPase FlhF
MIKPALPSRSVIVATVVIFLVAGLAYWLYAEHERKVLAQQETAQRLREQKLAQEREQREQEERERKAAEIERARRDEREIEKWHADLQAAAAKQRAQELQDRTARLKQRSDDAKRTIASLALVNAAVQTIRPFAFVGTTAQENALEILHFVSNACNKIQTAQSAPCIDRLKTAAGYYCQAVTQVSQQSIIDPAFFANENARLRLFIWIRDNGYQYDAAFNACQAFLDKERAEVKQENDELNKLRSEGVGTPPG